MDVRQTGELLLQSLAAGSRIDSIDEAVTKLEQLITAGKDQYKGLEAKGREIKVNEKERVDLLTERDTVTRELEKTLGILDKAGYSTPLNQKVTKQTRL